MYGRGRITKKERANLLIKQLKNKLEYKSGNPKATVRKRRNKYRIRSFKLG